jgi:hypothetical protein
VTYWISNRVFTVRVEATDGVITEAAPIVRKFLGQPIDNLLNWARRQGGLIVETWGK